jgi:hypothetical protein
MELRAGEEGVDLVPGGSRALGREGIQAGPEGSERHIDDCSAGVEEPQRLRRVRPAEVIAQGR